MENLEQKISEQPNKYKILRAEIAEIKSQEARNKGTEEYHIHFIDIDVPDLEETDLNIYEKFKNQTLTREEFEEYRKEFLIVGKDKKSISRSDFAAWLVNKLWIPKDLKWYNKKEYESWISQGLISENKEEEQEKAKKE
jgi:hypothetical protein